MNDDAKIRQVISLYSEGMQTADADRLRKAFHPRAVLSGYLGDEVMAEPIETLFAWVASNPAPDGYSSSVLEITITNRVATATVRESDAHGDSIDHFHLLKVDDEWLIVSKLWDNP